MTSFSCRRCRTVLFSSDAISHSAASAGDTNATRVSTVKTKWGRDASRVGTGACTSVFLAEAPNWADCEGNQGGLNCPKCGARVGNYSWSGATCSCGRWITPAFQFPLAKVDPRGVVDLSTIVRGAGGVGGDVEPAVAGRNATREKVVPTGRLDLSAIMRVPRPVGVPRRPVMARPVKQDGGGDVPVPVAQAD